MDVLEYTKMSEEEKQRYWRENYKSVTDGGADPVDEALVKLFGPDSKNEQPSIKTYPELDVEASSVEMRLYECNDNYFKSMTEVEEYVKSEKVEDVRVTILEYLRHYAGKSDIIHEVSGNDISLYLRACDEEVYGIYNHERSNREGKFIWEFSEGSIEEYYAAFRRNGIVFEDDVYGKINDEKRRFDEMCKAGNYFNSRGNSEDLSQEELNKQRYISSMINFAEKFPQDLAFQYKLDDLLQGMAKVDSKLADRLESYNTLLKREQGEDQASAEYAHIQELKKLTVRELDTYFKIAENFEHALRTMDYIYEYQTHMPDVSAIIYASQKMKMLEKLQ